MRIGVIGDNTELRDPFSEAKLTAAEYKYLLKHPNECPAHLVEEFEAVKAYEKRSAASFRGVATRRAAGMNKGGRPPKS